MKKIMYAILVCAVLISIAIALGQDRIGKGGVSKITLYGSNGFVIMEWTTPYDVVYENGQYSFIASKTDHRIRITGTVVVDSAP